MTLQGEPGATFNGNEIGAILAEYILTKQSSTRWHVFHPNNYVIKTLVTTELIRRIAESPMASVAQGDLLVGFKHIAHVIDRDVGPINFRVWRLKSRTAIYGRSVHVETKMVPSPAMLMSELAAELEGQTVFRCTTTCR